MSEPDHTHDEDLLNILDRLGVSYLEREAIERDVEERMYDRSWDEPFGLAAKICACVGVLASFVLLCAGFHWGFWLFLGALAIAALIGLAGIAIRGDEQPRLLYEELYRRGYPVCPVCGYDLSGLAPETDLCPECAGPFTPRSQGS